MWTNLCCKTFNYLRCSLKFLLILLVYININAYI